jgi:hypothetical protein
VKVSGDKVSLATVYNTLRAFCDAGLMQEVTVDGTRSYFDTRIDDHPHFYHEDEGHLTDAPSAGCRDPCAARGARRLRDRQGRRGHPPAQGLSGPLFRARFTGKSLPPSSQARALPVTARRNTPHSGK